MTFCKIHFRNPDGLTASVCYDKYSSVPYLSICEPISHPLVREIYRNYYHDEKSAVKALKAYAKRHGMKPFSKDE